MSTDIQLATRAFEPADIEQAASLAKTLFASGLLPRAVTRPEAAFAIIVCGRELGLTAFQSLRGIHIIEGKTTLAADTMLALALQDAKCEYFRCLVTSAEVATYETKRRGASEPMKLSFTIEEARNAGVTGKDNWKKYAPAMLRARCISALARMVYPDVFMGIYDPDELSQEAPVQAAVTVVSAKEEKKAKTAPAVEVVKEKAPEPAQEAPVQAVSTPSPAVQAQAATVAATPPPATEPAPPGLATLEDFVGAIGKASSQDELRAIGKEAIGPNNMLSKADLEKVREAWGARVKVLSPVGKAAA